MVMNCVMVKYRMLDGCCCGKSDGKVGIQLESPVVLLRGFGADKMERWRLLLNC